MDNIDVVPELLAKIQKDFQQQFNSSREVAAILGSIKSKMATYKEANEFAVKVGEMLANSYGKFLTPETLPEGRMWFNIASRILEPTLHTNYSLITDVCQAAQTKLNKDAGIGLKAIKPGFDENRVKGIVDKVSNTEDFEEVEWVLQEPVVNFSQSVVDDSIKTNAEFHYKSGLTPKIRRTAEPAETRSVTRKTKKGKTYTVTYHVPCKWCQALAGTYDYPEVPTNVYRKHENCRCTVEYISDGKRQNVHTKKWVGEMPADERRKQIERQAKEAQAEARRQAEAAAVAELMRQNPSWSERGATIYYRMNMAPKS